MRVRGDARGRLQDEEAEEAPLSAAGAATADDRRGPDRRSSVWREAAAARR